MEPVDELNPEQRAAVEHAGGPLLVIAGAGTGKTHTLAHRVAQLIVSGAEPGRILLLTFSRRAAAAMIRRAERIVARAAGARAGAGPVTWAGTFHAVANRVLRLHAADVSLDPSFTVLDRGDGADLVDLLRHELGLAVGRERRFPQKGTCLAIYSRVVNAEEPLATALESTFPWCAEWEPALRRLFRAYVEAKAARHLLDYDDLLVYWRHLMGEPALAARVAGRFDHVLVDEYQDTNALQAAILGGLRPGGDGLTVVGDDAQSIYAFRAATVRNILDFPQRFTPAARVVTLTRNYRSTQGILDASNAVIGLAPERFTKDLTATRGVGPRPLLVTVEDEAAEVDYVVERVLTAREAGMPLRRQAVLFRTAHHSDALEVELGRRNVPYVKYGGLKFLEAAHVKDALCVLRWGENPRDSVAAFRAAQILPGVGPGAAARLWRLVEERAFDLAAALAAWQPPPAALAHLPALVDLMARLRDAATPWPAQMGLVRRWYEPHLVRLFDAAHTRAGDLEALDQIAAGYDSRERFLSELALDPPEGAGAEAGTPWLDEDFLILSTIHSAKGQEWDAVTVLHASDGCIPSDMATGHPDQIEEERRLLYVAMTRARDSLTLVHPLRFFIRQQKRYGDRHVTTPRTRFVPDAILNRFERVAVPRRALPANDAAAAPAAPLDVAARLRDQWQ